MQTVSHALVVCEKEQLVFLNGTAEAAAKLIPAIAGNAVRLTEVVGCVETRGAIILEKRSMECVCS